MIDDFKQHKTYFNFDKSNVCETSKKAEIKDDFGHTRFTVVLTDFDDLVNYSEHDDLRYKDKDFQVEVYSFCYSSDPLILVSESFEKYDAALDFYYKNIELYVNLCKAETRHYQNIHIYANKINYHSIHYKCCENCKWCHKLTQNKHNQQTKYLCMNEKLFVADSIYHPEYDSAQHSECGPHIYNTLTFKPIHPEVEITCVCDYWESNNEKNLTNE